MNALPASSTQPAVVPYVAAVVIYDTPTPCLRAFIASLETPTRRADQFPAIVLRKRQESSDGP